MKLVAGIDLGTQSIKVVLYDYENLTIVEKTSHDLDIISSSDGTREQTTTWYKDAMLDCFSRLSKANLAKVEAVGVSGQQHGFVPLNAKKESLYNIKLWNDTSTTAECEELTKLAGGDAAVIAEVGNLFLTGFTAGKILWLKKNKPELFAALKYIMLPHDYINFLLTDNYVMEAGDASGTALLDPKTKTWSKKACSLIDEGLYDLLPSIIEFDEKAGLVSEEAAALYSLPVGIPVSSGGGDNMMGAIGTGCVSDGFLTMSLGTSGTLYGYSDKVISNPIEGVSGFCSSTGGYLPLLCTMNCTVAQEEMRKLFDLSVKDFDALAAEAEIGAEGIMMVPFFNGERSPNLPNGKASINGLTLANSSKANICRAAMESAIFALRSGLDSFRKLGFCPREIRLIGGGAKSPLWRQIAADVFNLPLQVPALDEAAAIGGAIQALACLYKGKQTIEELCNTHIKLNAASACTPIEENVVAYDAAYKKYLNYLNSTIELYK